MNHNECFFDLKNGYTSKNIGIALQHYLQETQFPIIACIGSDITIGDSVGPLVGTMLEKKNIFGLMIYGTLKSPITAKEVISLGKNIRKLHTYQRMLAIDGAVGDEKEVGMIKLQRGGLYPGIGVGKKIAPIGDVAIMGIVAPRSKKPYQTLQNTRLSLIYRQAAAIADGIYEYLISISTNARKIQAK